MPGHIIAFEGLDKAGKKTQTTKLVDWLISNKHTAIRMEFPAYDTPIGQEIKKHFEKPYLNPRELQMLLEMNRYEMQTVISEYRNNYEFVVLDRYNLSGLAYGTADGLDVGFFRQLQTNLIKPDLGIYIEVSPLVSMQRKHPDRKDDYYETDMSFLKKVHHSYKLLVHTTDNYVSVYGMTDVESIHNAILSWIKIRFNLQ